MKTLAVSILLGSLALTTSCLHPRLPAEPAQQGGGPVRRPDRMTAELTGPVSLNKGIPLTLTLFSKSDGSRRDFTNYSFMFVVLGEDGGQVGGPNVFIREAITVELQLDGKEATYEPRIHFYRDKEGLVPGRKYQLVCAMPPCDLAAAVWFTLVE